VTVVPHPSPLLYLVAGGVATATSLVGMFGGYGLARRHQRLVAQVQLALEQILDRLERGEGSRSALPAMLSAAEQIIRGRLSNPSRDQWPKSRP
jgi:Flp pilus assembly protein TadB